MRIRLFQTLLVTCACVGSAFQLAAQTALQAHRMAVIFEADTGNLRPILGFPGGAFVGSPLESELEQAILSPDGNFAISGHPGEYVLRPLPGSVSDGSVVRIPLGTALNPIWSADSKALAFLNGDRSVVSLYERVNSKEGWTGPKNITLPEPAGKILALDAQRNQLWFTVERKTEEASFMGLFVANWASADFVPTQFSSAGDFRDPISIFVPPVESTKEWAVADRGTNRIYRLQNQEGNWKSEAVFSWGPERSDLEVVGVAGNSAGMWFSVWKGSEALVCWHENDGRCVEELALDAQPKDLDILPGSKFFSFTRKFPSREALSILDTAERKAYFIPWGDEAK